MTSVFMIYGPLDEERDRVVIDVGPTWDPMARWIFKNGRWIRSTIIALGVTQVTVTDMSNNQTWTFTQDQVNAALTRAKTLHGRVVQR